MTAGARTMRQLTIILIAASIHMVCSFMQQNSAVSGGFVREPQIKDPSEDIIQCRKNIRYRDPERRIHLDSLRCKKRTAVRLSMSTNDESAKTVGWTVLKEGHLYLPKGEQNENDKCWSDLLHCVVSGENGESRSLRR
jgi:hypothetical protein